MMLYWFARFVVRSFIKLFNSWDITGAENLPEKGPVVLVANHVSQWDPPILGCSVNRVVHFMAKEELFKIPILGKLLLALQAIPVKRGKPDRKAMRIALKYLNEGEVLGVFPEGTRSKTASLLPFQQGAALFALKTGACIVPVGLLGTRGTFPNSLRGRIQVRIGKPLIVDSAPEQGKISSEDLEKVTRQIEESIFQLIKE
jgi:1-acyl-sn-glycerol-3-phosphate acyltransferase